MTTADQIRNFPVAYFTVIMGMAGLTLAWQKGEALFGVTTGASTVLLLLSVVLFGAVTAAYGWKIVRYRDEVKAEFARPADISLFPAFSISLVLLCVAILPLSTVVSQVLWVCGAALHLLLTLAVMTVWMNHDKFEIQHISPAWFIPVVGNILVPIGGVAHGHVEISWFFFSVGLVFWLVLMTIIFYRIIFHNPLPSRVIPTLFILLAPPAAGFISYASLTGGVDAFARVLFYFAVFTFLLLLFQIRSFFGLEFFLSWWAYSFPLAAMSIATTMMYQHTGLAGFRYLSVALLGLTTLVIALLAFKTLAAIRQ